MQTVRVVPVNDDVRRVLRHPNGAKFRSTGSIEWPMDRFTARRLAEGVITVEEQRQERGHRRAAQHQAPAE